MKTTNATSPLFETLGKHVLARRTALEDKTSTRTCKVPMVGFRSSIEPLTSIEHSINLRDGSWFSTGLEFDLKLLAGAKGNNPNTKRKKSRIETPESTALRISQVKLAKRLATEVTLEREVINSRLQRRKNDKSKTLQRIADEKKEKADRARSEAAANRYIEEALALEELVKFKQGEVSPLRHNRSNREKFESFMRHVAKKHGAYEYLTPEVEALVAYYCAITKIDSSHRKHNGFLLSMPDGYLDSDGDSFLEEARVLASHCLIDFYGTKTAEDIENFKWEELTPAGLGRLKREIPPTQIVELMVPGATLTRDPLIREWALPAERKWQGEEGKTRVGNTMAWVLEHATGVYDSETSEFDAEKMRQINWSNVFKEYGLLKMLEQSEHLPSTVEAIDLGAKRLTGKSIIGIDIERGQLPPWWITTRTMWKDEDDGEKLIDYVTDFVVEKKLRVEEPGMFESVDSNGLGKGKMLAEKVRGFGKWSDTYNDVATDCLRNSKIKIHEALSRRYPELFGYEKDQVKPWEIRAVGMWDKKKGKGLFKVAFAYMLAEEGLGTSTFNPEGTPPIVITKRDFDNWNKERLERGEGWNLFFTKHRLTGGFKAVCDSDINKAFVNLLGRVRKSSGCYGNTKLKPEHVRDKGKNMSRLVSELLVESSERFNFESIDICSGDSSTTQASKRLNGTKLVNVVNETNPRRQTVRGRLFYKCLASAILPSPSKDELLGITDRYSALQKIAEAKFPKYQDDPQGYYISDNELKELLRIIRDEIIDDLNIGEFVKEEGKGLINKVLEQTRDGRGYNVRDVLLAATNADFKFGRKNSLLSLINAGLESGLRLTLYERTDGFHKACEEIGITGPVEDEVEEISVNEGEK